MFLIYEHACTKESWSFSSLLALFYYTANIYSQFTVIGCVTCTTLIWQWLLQGMPVHMTFNVTVEYSFRSIAILGCNICSQITVAHVTLPKAVISTVKIFAVHKNHNFQWDFTHINYYFNALFIGFLRLIWKTKQWFL